METAAWTFCFIKKKKYLHFSLKRSTSPNSKFYLNTAPGWWLNLVWIWYECDVLVVQDKRVCRDASSYKLSCSWLMEKPMRGLSLSPLITRPVSLFFSGLMFSPQCAGPSWVKLIKEYSGEVKPSDLSNKHRHRCGLLRTEKKKVRKLQRQQKTLFSGGACSCKTICS